MNIHHTAIVSPLARMGWDVTIGPFAIVHAGVSLGNNVTIRAHAVVGSSAEKHGYFKAEGHGVDIGDDTIISEFVTIHSGTEQKTRIGKRCVVLAHAHVGHDAQVADDCTVSCGALIGGHSIVGAGANLSLGCILHQFSRIGSWAMVGMGCVVPKNQRILPGRIYVGAPARSLKDNAIGLKRMNVTDLQLTQAQMDYIDATPEWKHK